MERLLERFKVQTGTIIEMPGKAKTIRRTPPKARAAKKQSASGIRRYINLPGHEAALPFSDAVLVGDTLYISGRVGLDPATGDVPTDIDAELRLLLDGFEAVLAEANMNMNHVVWVQVYAPDVSLWQRFNAAYLRRFAKQLPARAFLGSGSLIMGARFEMLGVAVRK
jgi:enamine deaminase RidA (YjgF/YER057c/UK114 family)